MAPRSTLFEILARPRTLISRVVALIAVSAVVFSVPVDVLAQSPSEKTDAEKKEAEKKPEADKPGKPKAEEIPEIPADELPKSTRQPPDPTKVQFVREKVSVDVQERVWPQEGDAYEPKTNVSAEYLREYFRRAGFDVVDDGASAKFRISGKVETVFEKELKFRKRVIAWQYITSAKVEIKNEKGETLEVIAIDEFPRDGAKDEKTTVLDCRRFLAKQLSTRLLNQGDVFANRQVVQLLTLLRKDPLDLDEPLRGEKVVEKLADIGLPAVPYLLEAMTDTSTVLADATYPELQRPSDLKVYHLADKALEEIFQKVSRMGLKTPTRHRFLIIRGWENEWRRFCRPFRESPQYKVQLERAKARRAAAEKAANAEKAAKRAAEGAGGR